MKILITCQKNSPDSLVDPRFGRSPWFAVVDVESDEVTFFDNAATAAGRQGAGIAAAKSAINLGVEYLLTGNCGPNAFKVLQAAGINVIVGIKGNIKEVVTGFRNYQYTPVAKPNVEGHW
jgi:predicted Fe-Mo cluster-binding NifX family protein